MKENVVDRRAQFLEVLGIRTEWLPKGMPERVSGDAVEGGVSSARTALGGERGDERAGEMAGEMAGERAPATQAGRPAQAVPTARVVPDGAAAFTREPAREAAPAMPAGEPGPAMPMADAVPDGAAAFTREPAREAVPVMPAGGREPAMPMADPVPGGAAAFTREPAREAVSAMPAGGREPAMPMADAVPDGAARQPVPENAPVPGQTAPRVPQRAADIATMDWAALEASVSGCTACGLCESRTHTVFGVGDRAAEWMLVGEAPGQNEDLQGEPFVGQAGKLLDNMLGALNLARGRNVFIANVLKCRPPENRDPAPAEVEQCEPYLRRQIALVRPKVIVVLGRFAAQSLLRTTTPIGKLRGTVHEYEGIPVVVTYHPAYLLRTLTDKARAWEDLCLAREVHDRAGAQA